MKSASLARSIQTTCHVQFLHRRGARQPKVLPRVVVRDKQPMFTTVSWQVGPLNRFHSYKYPSILRSIDTPGWLSWNPTPLAMDIEPNAETRYSRSLMQTFFKPVFHESCMTFTYFHVKTATFLVADSATDILRRVKEGRTWWFENKLL